VGSKRCYGEPLLISGILYKNEQAVDTIQTNGYGLGSFTLKPEADGNYYVILNKSDQERTIYSLPKAIQGPSIYVANAVCNDTLVVRMADRTGGMYYGMVHNYTDEIFSHSLWICVSPRSRLSAFRLQMFPKVLLPLHYWIVLAEPVAERLFFAHYNERAELLVATDQAEYQQRKKVKLSLQIKDASGKPVSGLVSVACVQNNRIDPRKMTDIESYTYLSNALALVPYKKDPMGNENDNLDYWEDILLVKGWRRYTWPDLLQAKADDTLQKFSSLLFSGLVTQNEKKVSKPYTLTLFSDSSFQMIQTDSTGHFIFKNEDLILPADGKKYLFINEKYKEDFTVQVNDPYRILTVKLTPQLVYENFEAGTVEKNTETMLLKQGEKATVLKEVIVTGKKDRSVNGMAASGRNECGDYVCHFQCTELPYPPFRNDTC
jgi:hypothetical protein